MTRLNGLIMIVLLLSSLYLVKIAYESRSLFVALDRAQNEERNLDTEFEKLQVEKRAQATPLRIEKMAREKLGMLPLNPAAAQYINFDDPKAPRPASGFSRDGLPLRPGEQAGPGAGGNPTSGGGR